MKQGLLSAYFEGVAVKRLSAVEADPERSNQHEFAGGHLRKMFGDEDRKDISARFIWLSDEQEGLSEPGVVTWYDSRRKQAHRNAEYRLYYVENPIASRMKEGDSFFVATRTDGTVMIIVAPRGSTVESQIIWLFGIDTQSQKDFVAKGSVNDGKLQFAARYILDELGIDVPEPTADAFEALVEQFGTRFPKTYEFAKIARDSLTDISAKDDADAVLVAWLEREELLFRALERRIVSERLRMGFMSGKEADVDGFISFSLSVQNRRKSRAGHSLEHHVEALLRARGLKFERQAVTEGKSRPDFLFPGHTEYHDKQFDSARLTMLATKSTLKDRWRQVLDEADRIPHKHLLTVEPSVSESQTDAMRHRHLQLVIPKPLHATYKATQQQFLMDVSQFIKSAEDRQRKRQQE
jgi:hypothetical protein